ncbi:MAG: DUF839 domain-containing protein [Proteobacteria bacterium]|nr:DUF839 domain-containing protein [Pseudomonadota bacterium]
MTTRRGFLIGAAATTAAFAGLFYLVQRPKNLNLQLKEGLGPLSPDPDKIIDLPKDFSYTVVSRAGTPMIDGLLTPGRPDGMATFPYNEDEVILVVNHEIGNWDEAMAVSPFGDGGKLFPLVPEEKVYDLGTSETRLIGGTTTIVYNLKEKKLVRQFLSLAGTHVNCSGGCTPWRSWLTCEETFNGPESYLQKRHGYIFEVPASAEPRMADPIPLKDMGRFVHEAACVDPKTNFIYLTEDAGASCLYRFRPNDPFNLPAGGTLDALMVNGKPGLKTSNGFLKFDRTPLNVPMKVSWLPLDDVDPVENDLAKRAIAKGAAEFKRGEGMWFGEDEFYFTCTAGGTYGKGQIWRYKTAKDTLELFLEPNDASVLEEIDNITIAPWGDLIVCEDGPMPNYLRGVTPKGEIYNIAKSDYIRSEFAGACFSPDGRVLFVNLQDAHMTLAITGPWGSLRTG